MPILYGVFILLSWFCKLRELTFGGVSVNRSYGGQLQIGGLFKNLRVSSWNVFFGKAWL
jgi:hypothetical protein